MTGAGFDRFEPFRFRRERELDAAGARALYASYSYVRALPAVRRERRLDAIAALVDTRFGGRARNVVLTALYPPTPPRAPQGSRPEPVLPPLRPAHHPAE